MYHISAEWGAAVFVEGGGAPVSWHNGTMASPSPWLICHSWAAFFVIIKCIQSSLMYWVISYVMSLKLPRWHSS